MALLPLSKDRLANFNWVILTCLIAAVLLPHQRGWLLLTFVVLVALRAWHGTKFSRHIRPLRGEELRLAQAESGRDWLPIRDQDRALLSGYQNLLLDEVAAFLAEPSSRTFTPEGCRWWWWDKEDREMQEMTIGIHVEGQDDVTQTHVIDLDSALIEVGRASPDDHDYDIYESRDVVLSKQDPEDAVAQALRWLREEIAELDITDQG